MLRLFFLIQSLELGGAQRQLIELVKRLDKSRFAVTVATFYAGGALHPEVAGIEGVRLISLEKQGRWDVLPFLWRLWRAAGMARPDIVHGYMGGANELCLLLGRAMGAKVVWGLLSSNVDFARYDWAAHWIFRTGAWLSRWSDLIVVNSWVGQQHHIAHGYCGERMVVIPNGIDTDRYRPDREAGRRVRAEWGVAEDETLIGLVARLDPMKDHPTFLRAAALLAKGQPGVRFVCVGDGPAPYKQDLLNLVASLGLGRQLIWAGVMPDMLAVYNAFDIVTLSSSGEGSPYVIGEAMACGVPCVVTDVGDSARIVGKMGVVVPPKDPQALAEGLEMMLSKRMELEPYALRERIIAGFSAQALVRATEKALMDLR